MSGGTPFSRYAIVVLRNGIPAIDWGQGLFQDIASGTFMQCTEKDISHSILDDELQQLKTAGVVFAFDANTVHLGNLPEPPRRAIA